MSNNGRSFDPERRRIFLEKVTEGHSVAAARRAVGVAKSTVHEWRQGPRPEHRAFAYLYLQATAACAAKAYTSLVAHSTAEVGGNGSVKATLAILGAHDSRFGDMDLRRAKLRIENETLRLNCRLQTLRAESEQLKLEVLRKAMGGGDVHAFGLALLLGDADLSLDARQELARLAVTKGWVMVERASWDEAPPAPPTVQ